MQRLRGTDGIIVLNLQVDVEGVDVRNCGGSGIVDTNTAANGKAIDNTSVNSRFQRTQLATAASTDSKSMTAITRLLTATW